MNQPVIPMVNIGDILPSKTNNLQREEWELKPEALKELTESIKQKGVISPILLRPDGQPGKYYLVCGERRFLAAKLAGLPSVPAYIRNLTDEEAFDMQVTENLQRKDVHPLKEAQAYKALMDANKKNTIQDLALRFNKPAEYIAHRLAFNNLIHEMKKEFFEGKMLIGHALLFSRLTEQDQNNCLKICKPQHTDTPGQYPSVAAVKNIIEQKLVRKLTKVPFSLDDAQLVINAGSCAACQKRSGAGLLFGDVKDQDTCFDGACFSLKMVRFLSMRIAELRNDEPELPIVAFYASVDPAIQQYLNKNKIEILSFKKYSDSNKSDKDAVRAFCVAGDKIGQVVFIKLYQRSASSGSNRSAPEKKSSVQKVDELKAEIKKSEESAQKKIAQVAAERLFDLKPYKDGDATPLTKYENAFILNLVDLEAYSDLQQKGTRAVDKLKPKNITAKSPGFCLERYVIATPTIYNQLMRGWIKDRLESIDDLDDAYAVLKIAQSFKGVNLKQIEQQVMADHQKLVDTNNAKIAAIRAEAKNPAPKKAAAKAAKK